MKLVEGGKILAVSKDGKMVRVITQTEKPKWYPFQKEKSEPKIGDRVLLIYELSLALGVKNDGS